MSETFHLERCQFCPGKITSVKTTTLCGDPAHWFYCPRCGTSYWPPGYSHFTVTIPQLTYKVSVKNGEAIIWLPDDEIIISGLTPQNAKQKIETALFYR